MNRSFFLCLAASRTQSSAWVTRSRFSARCVSCWPAFPSAPVLGSSASAPGRPGLFGELDAVGPEEARSRALALASVRRSNWACSFPAPSFHEDAVRRVASEGIIATKFTSPYSP